MKQGAFGSGETCNHLQIWKEIRLATWRL